MSGEDLEDRPEGGGSPEPEGKKPRRFWRVFWLAFLVVSLGYAWHSFYVPANDVAWAADLESARRSAAESGKPVLLFFTADWCVPCRIMKRQVFADAEVEAAINAGAVPVLIREGAPGAEEIFAEYEVHGTPVTIFTASDGRVLDYAVGGIGKAQFLELLGGVSPSAASKL